MVPYAKCKECRKAESLAWARQPKVRERQRILRNERVQDMRRRVIELLGSKCARCNIIDDRVLQVDHMNGGGRKERRSVGSYGFLLRVLEMGKDDYQLLCANCNWIKRMENKEYPQGGT